MNSLSPDYSQSYPQPSSLSYTAKPSGWTQIPQPTPSIALWTPSSTTPAPLIQIQGPSQGNQYVTVSTGIWDQFGNCIRKATCGKVKTLPGCFCTIIILAIIGAIIFIVATTPNFSIRMNRRVYPRGQLECYSLDMIMEKDEEEGSNYVSGSRKTEGVKILCAKDEYCYSVRLIQNASGDSRELLQKGCDKNPEHWLCSYKEEKVRKSELEITHQCWSVSKMGNRGLCTCTR